MRRVGMRMWCQLLVLLVLTAGVGYCQNPQTQRGMKLSAQAAFASSLDNLAEDAGVGYGGKLRLEYPRGGSKSIWGIFASLHHFDIDRSGFVGPRSPVSGHLRYWSVGGSLAFFSRFRSSTQLYVLGDIGLGIARPEWEGDYADVTATTFIDDLALSTSVGFGIRRSSFLIEATFNYIGTDGVSLEANGLDVGEFWYDSRWIAVAIGVVLG